MEANQRESEEGLNRFKLLEVERALLSISITITVTHNPNYLRPPQEGFN